MSLDNVLYQFASNFGTTVTIGNRTLSALTDSVDDQPEFLPDGTVNAKWSDTRTFSFSPMEFANADTPLPTEGQQFVWAQNGVTYTVKSAINVPFQNAPARYRVTAYRQPLLGTSSANPQNSNGAWGP
jgi:hypothetical protein